MGRASVSDLRKIFEQQRNNVAALEGLSAELKKRSCDAGFDLLAEVARALVAARKVQPVDTQHPAQAILSARKLTRPDGRPLFRYRLELTEWERLRRHLLQLTRTRAIERADERDAAVFAIYAAEWFRREFEGGAYRWDQLLKSLGGVTPEITASLARRGLKWWGRSAHRTDHGEQRLMSLALEGGFPTRLLGSREQGWLAGTLRRLIARTAVLGEQSLEAVVELAVADAAVPQTFRKPEFFTLLAELALAIVELRVEVAPDALQAGVPTSAWLDARREGWRDELPIALEGEGASRLIDELVSQSLDRLGGSAARCWRMLVRRDGGWSPGLRLAVDGEIRVPASIRTIQTRLRVHAIGDLGDRLAGEIALLDPPGEEGAWIARPRPAAPRRSLRNFAFSSPVQVELRSDGQRVAALTWSPAGEPIHAEVLAFVDERDTDCETAEELILLGCGSQRARHKAIYVWAPASHVATTTKGDALGSIWEGSGRRLFHITSPALVGSPDEDLGFYYEPNTAAGRAEILHLDGPESRAISAGCQVFIGVPAVFLQTGVARTAYGFGEVFWRLVGERAWTDLKRQRLGFGLVDLVWRSADTRAARDRRRFIILPTDLVVRSRAIANGGAEFWLEGAEGWRLEADPTFGYGAEAIDRGFRAVWSIDRRKTIALRLITPEGRTVEVTTRFPLGDGALVGANGDVLADNASVTLKQLRGARAFARGKGKLAIETTTRENRTVYHQVFEDECSLWSLRERIAALMEASDDLDAEVRVAFEPNGPSLRVRRFAYDIELASGTVRLSRPVSGTGEQLSFEWRSLADMTGTGQRTIAELSVADAMSMRAFALPTDLSGPGIVYLCEGEAVVSRPRFVRGLAVSEHDLNSLQKAVVQEGADYDASLRAAFEFIEDSANDSSEGLRWLHQLVAVSSRFPATTFNVLKNLGRRSRMLAHLIASSTTDEALERVWALEPELPFLWVLVSLEDWRQAFSSQYQRTYQGLRSIGWDESKAQATAAAQINVTIDKLISLDEDLRAPIVAAGLRQQAGESDLRSPRDLGQDRIRRLAGSDHERRRSSCFMTDDVLRNELEKLPQWFIDFHEDHWEGLQAPVVAALRAADLVKLLARQRLRIREAMLEDPEHFSEAYEACLLSLAKVPHVEVSA
ncbi:STY4851/ECs_5259 family protein [Aquidulcibacter paucihalophilus]|nr:STY4851/ECs_5259 family protein [Aquidulcibacter paucihalophilus]